MITIISDLIQKRNAYVSSPAEGSLAPDVYFNVISCSDKFGTLTGQKLENMRAGSRIATDDRKRHPADFVFEGAKQGSLVGIVLGVREDLVGTLNALYVLKYLGEHFDIHGGGIDLKFPHHESEVLQPNATLTIPRWQTTGPFRPLDN